MKPTPSRMTARQMTNWRERHNLTQDGAGEVLGIVGRAIRNYESGDRAIPKVVQLLCLAYDKGFKEVGTGALGSYPSRIAIDDQTAKLHLNLFVTETAGKVKLLHHHISILERVLEISRSDRSPNRRTETRGAAIAPTVSEFKSAIAELEVAADRIAVWMKLWLK